MGGVADGIPPWMDGCKVWGKEPEGLKRACRREDDWKECIFSLGNAVVPQQAYPILKAIADIEAGRCGMRCNGGCTET